MCNIRIFVSYCHEDILWLKTGEQFGLIPWLEHQLEKEGVEFWYDHALLRMPGIQFEEKIKEEIDKAQFALVLISLDFIASKFINAIELPRIRNRVEKNEMAIIPILVGPVDWDDESAMKWFKSRQILPSKSTPLIDFTNCPARWQQVRADIRSSIRSRIINLKQEQTPSQPALAVVPLNKTVDIAVTTPSKAQQSKPVRHRDNTVIVPHFHYGSVVPPEFFVGRELELKNGSDLVKAHQSFLLVGDFRSGKTSFGKMLIHQLMAENTVSESRILGAYFNLQQCIRLTPETFLEHTVLAAIGEIARQVFGCKYSAFISENPLQTHPELAKDHTFSAVLETFHAVRQRARNGARESNPLAIEEFVHFIQDLMEILREKGWNDFFIFYDEANRLPIDFSIDLLISNVEALSAAGVVSIYSVAAETAVLRNLFGNKILLLPFSSVGEIRVLLAKYYFMDGFRGADLPVSSEAIKELWHYSQGKPFKVQVLAGQCFHLAHDRKAPLVTGSHVRESFEALKNQNHPAFIENGQ